MPDTPPSTQPHCTECRTPDVSAAVAALTEKVDKLFDAVVAIGLELGVEGFEEEEE